MIEGSSVTNIAPSLIQGSLINIPSSSYVVASRFVKADTRSFVRLQIGSTSGQIMAGCRFDLNTGTKVASDSDIFLNGGTNVTSGIIPYPDGWYLCYISLQLPTTFTSFRFDTRIVPNESTFSYPGDGVSRLLVGPAQFEVGTMPTAYQKITTGIGGEWTPGNHAFQSTAASRPLLRQTSTLGVENITNGTFDTATTGWTQLLGTQSATGGRLRLTRSAGTAGRSASNAINCIIGNTYKVELERYKGTTAGTSVYLSISSTSITGALVTSSSTTDGYFTFTFVATQSQHWVILESGSGTDAQFAEFDNVSVKEVTGYLTTRNYLEFDGVDDYLVTNSINFTATDKMSAFLAVKKNTDAAFAIIVELSPAAAGNSGSFNISGPDNTSPNFGFGLRGDSTASRRATTFTAPINAVISCLYNIGGSTAVDEILPRVNGLVPTLTAVSNAGTGNFGTYPIYIGRRAVFNQAPFSGYMYDLCIIGRTATATEITKTEGNFATHIGVTLP